MHTCLALEARGVQVIGIDSFDELLYSKNLKVARSRYLKECNIKIVEADLVSNFPIENMKGVNAIINLAALPGQVKSWSHFKSYNDANVALVNNLLSLAHKFEIRHFVQASTSSVYGRNAIGGEEQGLHPISPYGVTKLAAEKLIQAYSENFSVPYSILRFFSVYGPGQRPDMALHKFLFNIFKNNPIEITGDGTQVRDLTYVGDLVEGLFNTLEVGATNEIFNISGGTRYSINELVEYCFAITGQTVDINYTERPAGDQQDTFGSTTKAREILKFEPNTPIEIGLTKQYEWMIANETSFN
jgi:nucleoside-diphosphate-sugar epimerase